MYGEVIKSHAVQYCDTLGCIAFRARTPRIPGIAHLTLMVPVIGVLVGCRTNAPDKFLRRLFCHFFAVVKIRLRDMEPHLVNGRTVKLRRRLGQGAFPTPAFGIKTRQTYIRVIISEFAG